MFLRLGILVLVFRVIMGMILKLLDIFGLLLFVFGVLFVFLIEGFIWLGWGFGFCLLFGWS